MDELQEWEMNTMIKNIPYLNRNEKEMDRYKLYVTVQANSKKRIDIEKLIELPWDKEFKNQGTKMTDKEIKYYHEKAAEMEKKFANITNFQDVNLESMMTKKTQTHP